MRDSKKGLDYILYRAMRKYGVENFTIEEIDKALSKEDLNKKEASWIYELKSMSYQVGYNMRSLDGRLKTSQRTRDKISKSLLGKKKPQYISDEEKSKIAKENGLKTFKNKNNWAVKNGSKPFKVYKAICIQKSKRNQPSIYKKGDFVGEWLMTTECAKDLQISSQHISTCISGNKKQHKGYIFERI